MDNYFHTLRKGKVMIMYTQRTSYTERKTVVNFPEASFEDKDSLPEPLEYKHEILPNGHFWIVKERKSIEVSIAKAIKYWIRYGLDWKKVLIKESK